MAKNVLGKGLHSLLSKDSVSIDNSVCGNVSDIFIDRISLNPYQPRKSFDEDAISELAFSIKEYGLIQPVVVTLKSENSYQLVVGERRFRACLKLGFRSIPAIVKDVSDDKSLEIALIENIQRQDLNVIEEAIGYRELIEKLSITHQELSRKISKSRAFITNKIRLLKLPLSIQEALVSRKITEGHARALLSLHDISLADNILEYIIDNRLSVRKLENLVIDINKYGIESLKLGFNSQLKVKSSELIIRLQDIQSSLNKKLNIDVRFKGNSSEDRGRIEINYKNSSELLRLLQFFDI